jgi:hypothetical protein
MYFTTSQTGNDRLGALIGNSARIFGASLILEENAHVPFESVVVAMSQKGGIPAELAARQVFEHDPHYRALAFRIGVEEVTRSYGGDEKLIRAYRNTVSEASKLRFESAGGVQDDLASVKNRLAAMAVGAYWARQKDDSVGVIPEERQFVDLLKSLRRSVEGSIGNGQLSPDLGEKVVAEVEAASTASALFGLTEVIEPLVETARDELYAEHEARVMARYSSSVSHDGPTPG